MLIVIIYIVALCLGLAVQKYSRFYTINLIGVLLGFIFPVLISNSVVLDFIVEKTQANKFTIIITVMLYSLGTSISFVIFKISKFKRMEKHIEYSDYFVHEAINNFLDGIRSDFKKYPKIYSDDVYITLYFVKRVFLEKKISKICRIAHVGVPSIISDNWNGVVKDYKYSSLGLTAINKTYNIVNYKEIEKNDFKGIPNNVLTWLIKNASYKINAPFEKDGKVIFIISVTSIDKNFEWNSLSANAKKIQIDSAKKILENYKINISGLYDFFNCTI